MLRWIVVVGALLGLLQAPGVAAAAETAPFCQPGQKPEFTLGFAALHDRLSWVMGDAVECEHPDPASGDTVQHTRNGVAVYRAAINAPTFVIGTRHWALTVAGLVYWDGPELDPPANALLLFPTDESGSLACGGYTVAWSNPQVDFGPPPQPTPGTLVVQDPGGTTVLTESVQANLGERMFPQLCGDLLGDGSAALLYTTYSGGAHCCSTAFVISLEAAPRALLHAELGNAGGIEPRQLDGGGPLELTSASDTFAYFDELPFAASPFLPLAFAYDAQQGEYVEATRSFPELIQADLDQTLQEIDQAVQDGEPVEQETTGLKAFAEYALLGQADQGLAEVKGRVGAEAAAWLDAHAQDALTQLAQAYR